MCRGQNDAIVFSVLLMQISNCIPIEWETCNRNNLGVYWQFQSIFASWNDLWCAFFVFSFTFQLKKYCNRTKRLVWKKTDFYRIRPIQCSPTFSVKLWIKVAKHCDFRINELKNDKMKCTSPRFKCLEIRCICNTTKPRKNLQTKSEML